MNPIAARRLANQRLVGPPLADPQSVVAWFGAVQGQEYALAQWALALRLPPTTERAIEAAFAAGDIVRTHAMRPTWHFVAPTDIRWLQALTGPRVQQVNAGLYRNEGMDSDLRLRAKNAIVRALENAESLTRPELGEALAQAGIPNPRFNRLAYFVMDAELEALICSGPKRGNQQTYALLDRRVPPAPRLTRDEALAELTRRYFTSHGPATPHDFAWWSGLTVADARNGLSLLGADMQRETIEGTDYWFAADAPPPAPPGTAFLLPVYDECTIAYRNHSAVLDPQYAEQIRTGFFTSAFMVDGEIIGMWRRIVRPKAAQIELAPFRPLAQDEQAAFESAAARYGAFLERPVTLTVA